MMYNKQIGERCVRAVPLYLKSRAGLPLLLYFMSSAASG